MHYFIYFYYAAAVQPAQNNYNSNITNQVNTYIQYYKLGIMFVKLCYN